MRGSLGIAACVIVFSLFPLAVSAHYASVYLAANATNATTQPATTQLTTTQPTTTVPTGPKPEISSVSGGYIIGNFVETGYAGLNIHGTQLGIIENYITPVAAGISINATPIYLPYGTAIYVGTFSGLRYYARLYNISYSPGGSSIRLNIFDNFSNRTNERALSVNPFQLGRYSGSIELSTPGYEQNILNFTSLGLQMAITYNGTGPAAQFTMNYSNATGTGTPKGFSKDFTTDFTFTPPGNISIVGIYHYPCASNGATPFMYSNGAWQRIGYMDDPAGCTLTFDIPSDPIIGMFTNLSATSTTTAPTSQPTTLPPASAQSSIPPAKTTTVQQPQQSSSSYEYIGIGMVVLIAVAALAYSYMRRRKPPEEEEAAQDQKIEIPGI